MSITEIVEQATQLSADLASGSGIGVLVALIATVLLGVYWSALKKVAEAALLPWIAPRFLRLTVATLLIVVAALLRLVVGGILVLLCFLTLEYLITRKKLSGDTAWMRAAQVLVPLGVLGFGGLVDWSMRRLQDQATHVYLVVSFERSNLDISKDELLEVWRQYCAALREIAEGIPGVVVQPDKRDEETFTLLDLTNNAAKARAEALRAKADLVLRNVVNIQRSGDADKRNFKGSLRVEKIDGQTLAHLPTVQAQSSHLKFIALHVAWSFFSELRTNDLLGRVQFDEAAALRIKKNLLQSYKRFLDVEIEAPVELQARLASALSSSSIDDTDVTWLLTRFSVPHNSPAHVQEERAMQRAAIERLRVSH